MGHTVKQLEELRRRLSELPVADDSEREVNKREAIAMLAGEISKLQKKGYSYEMIVKALSSNGLDMSVATLKSYITKVKKMGTRRSKRKPAVVEQNQATESIKNKPLSSTNHHPSSPQSPSILPARSSAFTPRIDSVDI